MKACPVCQSTFDDRVDFCFEDGSPLVDGLAGDPSDAPDMAAAALPQASASSGFDAPEAVGLTERRSEVPADAPRRTGGRGMFSRPSVADMLSIAEPGMAPAGGPAPQTSAPVPKAVDVPVMDVPEAPLESPPEEPAQIAVPAAVIPPDVTMPLPKRDRTDASALDEDPPDEVETPAIVEEAASVDEAPEDVPPVEEEPDELPAAAAIVVPTPTAAEAISDVGSSPPLGAGAIFDAPDPTGFFEETGASDSLIEDPGFPDVSVSTVPEPVGYEDQPFFADGVSTKKSAAPPIWLILGGLALVGALALVLLAVLLGSEEDQIVVHKAPKVQAPQRVVEPAPEPPPVVEVVEPEELPVEDEDGDLEAEVVPVEEAPAEVEEPPVEPELPVEPPPAPTPQPPPPPPPAPTPAPAPAPSAWTGTPAPPPAAPSTGSTSPWGAPAEASQRGRLTISTEPSGAMVYVDDRRVGRSPTGTEVTYGSHTVRAELDNYRTLTRNVDVQVPQFSIPLRMQSSSVSGTCSLMGPVGANVVMDGRNIGSLPRSVSCTQGPHRFRVTPTGGSAYTLTRDIVIAEPGAAVTVSLGGS